MPRLPTASAALLIALGAASPAGAQQRNIVFILADDHRYDAMSFMGHTIVKTPSIDSIARARRAPAQRLRHHVALLARAGRRS